MKKSYCLKLCIAIGLFVSQICYADITRSCNAYYEISTLHQGMQIKMQYGHFSTQGSCGNRAVANRCRERARAKAHSCMKTHWEPPSQRIAEEGFWKRCTNNYPISNPYLRGAIEKKLCRTFRTGEMTINIKGITTGGKKCPKHTDLAATYRFKCDY